MNGTPEQIVRNKNSYFNTKVRREVGAGRRDKSKLGKTQEGGRDKKKKRKEAHRSISSAS